MLSLESASAPEDGGAGAVSVEPREAQARLLRSWLFPVPAQTPVWCWGGCGTGKTHLVRQLLAKEPRVALVDCATVVMANRGGRSLYECILNQLSGHVVSQATRWASVRTATNANGFLARLRELNEKDQSFYIVFDNADALVDGVDSHVFSVFVEMAQELPEMALGVIFIARRDWRRCARGFCGGSHPLEVHFEAWTEAEEQRVLLQMVSEAEKGEGGAKWRVSNRSAREKWTARLVQSVHRVTGPLFGMHNLFNMELDGFKMHQSPIKQPGGGSERARVEQEQARLAKQYLSDVYGQEPDKLMQLDDQAHAIAEAATPKHCSTPVVVGMESVSKKQRREASQQAARGERFAALNIGPQKSQSLPVYDAALVVAAFCASIVPKSMDKQIFSEAHLRKRQNKSKSTVGGSKDKQSKSFSLERLLLIFRHVIGNAEFVPSPFWFSCLESVTSAGYLRRRYTTKLVSKFSCETPLAQVTRLAQEIEYRHLDDVLAAQL
jgi:hypothetical protein